MIIKLFSQEGPPGSISLWDTIEWDDSTLLKLEDARGLVVKMVAQSIQDWVAARQVQEAIVRHASEREVAKGEVEGEALARAITSNGEGDHGLD